MNKKFKNYLENKNRIELIDNNYVIECDCGKKININEVTFYHFIDMNYFNWWSYGYEDNDILNKKKQYLYINNKPFGYLGYIPLVNEVVYYIHKWFHKKDEILTMDCIYCEND